MGNGDGSVFPTIINALSELASAKDIIKKYEENEKCLTVVEEIREIDASLFREVTAKISYEKQQPYSFGNSKYMIDPEVVSKVIPHSSGYFFDRHDEISVTYYYGVLNDKIKIKNIQNKIEISYDANSFLIPYTIKGHESELNTFASILTDAGDDQDLTCINQVAMNQLSTLEDEYLKTLKEKYKDSNVLVYVNGTKISDLSEDDKKVTENPIDPMYKVEIG